MAVRRHYKGAAALTTITGAIGPAATTITIADATGWPDGSVGPFYVVVSPGLAAEESILIQSRTTTTLNVAGSGRGSNDTTAASHANGADIRHVHTKTDSDEANKHIADTAQDDHCFSEDTEILTENGWLGIDAVEEGVQAWTFDLSTQQAELEPIANVWRYGQHLHPRLVSIRNQDMGEVLVTPQHTMVWRRANAKNQKNWARRTAETLPRQFSMPASAVGHDHRVDLTDDSIRLLAWATTEGYMSQNGGFITIAQMEGALADRIQGILDRLGFHYARYKQDYDTRSSMVSFRVRSGFLWWAMDETDKTPRQELAWMSPRQARVFIAEAVLGDGTVSGGNKLEAIDAWLAGGPQPHMTLGAKSSRFVDFVQTLCVLNGMKSRNYRDPDGFNRLAIKATSEHSVSLSTPSPTARMELVPNHGRVWCVTVPKNQTVIARRPGTSPFIAGNTQYLNTARHDVTARHLFGTSIASAAPGESVAGDTASQGAATSGARSDHRHARAADSQGFLGVASMNSAQSGITAETTITNSQVAVTMGPGNRRIKLTCSLNISATVTPINMGDPCFAKVRIKRDGSTTVSTGTYFAVGGNLNVTVELTDEETVTGSKTYFVTLERATGTGTLAHGGPSFLLVEDMGQA